MGIILVNNSALENAHCKSIVSFHYFYCIKHQDRVEMKMRTKYLPFKKPTVSNTVLNKIIPFCIKMRAGLDDSKMGAWLTWNW